jgi:hypothetical protein
VRRIECYPERQYLKSLWCHTRPLKKHLRSN